MVRGRNFLINKVDVNIDEGREFHNDHFDPDHISALWMYWPNEGSPVA
jgi:hypothetical protein